MPRRRSSRQHRGESKWTLILRAWRASGSSARAFCREQGVSLSSFQRWRRRLETPVASEFVELRPSASPVTSSAATWEVEVALPNGIHLRLRG